MLQIRQPDDDGRGRIADDVLVVGHGALNVFQECRVGPLSDRLQGLLRIIQLLSETAPTRALLVCGSESLARALAAAARTSAFPSSSALSAIAVPQ
jgi:hypothetical protein